MKKIVVATAVLAAFSASAFAATVPVTNINAGETKVAVEYSLSKKTAQDTKRKDGFGVSAQQGVSDNLAAQYSFNKVHRTGTDIKDHQLALVYKVHPNVNVYGAGTAIRTNDTVIFKISFYLLECMAEVLNVVFIFVSCITYDFKFLQSSCSLGKDSLS